MKKKFYTQNDESEELILFQSFPSRMFENLKTVSQDKLKKQVSFCIRKISRWTMLLFIVVSTAFVSTGCTKHSDNSEHPIVSDVKVETITKASVDNYYETSATVKAKTNSVISSMITGKVTSLAVQEGDSVRAGQLLLTIDSRDTAQKAVGASAGVSMAQKGVEQASQNKRMAEVTYQRYKNLYNEKVITKQEFDQYSTQKNVAALEYQKAQAGVQQARAGLGEVRVYQSYSRVTAPISGIVTQRNIDLGSTAIQGQPILTIEGPGNQELVANVDESYLKKIHKGQDVNLVIDGKTVKTKITTVVQSVDPTTRTFKVKLDTKGLSSGLYAKVQIPIGKKDAIAVPLVAIVQKGQLTGVYTVDDKNIISYRLIRTGKTVGDKVEVISGLMDGDKIVVSGVDKAVDGGEIK